MIHLRLATPNDLLDLQKICIKAYTVTFSRHWKAEGLKKFCIRSLTSPAYCLSLIMLILITILSRRMEQT